MILARKYSLAAVARIPHHLNLALVTAVTLILLGFFLRTEVALTGGELGVPLDDAWIHYQFARNLSQGHGFSYNPGEPTPGSTAPLWTLLLAVVGLFNGDFLAASLVLSAIFLLLTAGLSYGLAFSLTQSRRAGLLAALAVACTGRMLWAGLAGMETTAFAAFSVAAVWAYTRQGLRLGTALLFGLASQLRPEGHALFALALVDTGWEFFTTEARRARREEGRIFASSLGWRFFTTEARRARRKKREIRREKLEERGSHFSFLISHFSFLILLSVSRRLILPLLVYALVAAPYAVFGLATTGKPLPNTFYAKVGTEHFFSWRTLRETIGLHWYDNPISLLLLAPGLAPAWRRSRLSVLWLLGLPLLTAVIIDFTWHHGRYTMPLIPFQMIIAAAGADWLLRRREKEDGRREMGDGRWAIPVLAVVLGLVFVGAGLWRLPGWATMLGHNANEILEIDVALGRWLADNTPPDALIAVDDIGAIAFLSQRRIVDLNGLVSPEMWPALEQPVGLARDQVATRILSDMQPDYLAAFPLWHWAIVMNPAVAEPVHRVESSTHTIIFMPEAFVYRTTWPYVKQARPEVSRTVTLGDAVQLRGYDLLMARDAEQPVELTLYWQSVATVTADYDVFVHVLDDGGEIVAQVDQEPVGGLAPTGLWRPGDVVRDSYQIKLLPELTPGTYTIQTGMYRRQTGERLAATGDGVAGNAIVLGRIDWPP